jgi:tetratricopeptide (TPR) repeat protein
MRTANSWRGAGLVAAVLAVALAPPAAAQALGPGAAPPTAEQRREYSDCLALAREAPKRAHDAALAWHAAGGGDPALHCIAVALLGMGDYDQAARQMEDLAEAMAAREEAMFLRADLLGQAGNAWLIASRPENAEAALDRALALSPDDPGLLVDRGIARTSQERFWEALDDFNRALEIQPGLVDALVFRATAWRGAGSPELAAEDAERALALSPDNLDALLERGAIRARRGEAADARADWLRVIELAPEGPIREAARRNLETLDVTAP